MISVEGRDLEQFANLAASNGDLWQIRRMGDMLWAKTDIKSFRKLRKIARQTHCRVRILDKQGMPFRLFRLSRRWMLAVGCIMFLLLLYTASSMIWWVDVDIIRLQDGGTDTRIEQRVSDTLAEWVWPGMFQRFLDTDAVEAGLMAELPDLAWVSVSMQGVRLTIRGVEALARPESLDARPADLVSKGDGVVERIQSLEGTPMVQPGDTIMQGQLLISHSTTKGDVHARGEVWAQRWLEKRVSLPLFREVSTFTGETFTRKWLEVRTVFGNAVFPGKLPSEPVSQDPNLRWEVVRNEIAVPGEGLYMPLVQVQETFMLMRIDMQPLAEEDVLREALGQARSELSQTWNGDVLDELVNWWISDSHIEGSVSWEVLQQVAVPQWVQ